MSAPSKKELKLRCQNTACLKFYLDTWTKFHTQENTCPYCDAWKAQDLGEYK